jgi:hypothetical protein
MGNSVQGCRDASPANYRGHTNQCATLSIYFHNRKGMRGHFNATASHKCEVYPKSSVR